MVWEPYDVAPFGVGSSRCDTVKQDRARLVVILGDWALIREDIFSASRAQASN